MALIGHIVDEQVFVKLDIFHFHNILHPIINWVVLVP